MTIEEGLEHTREGPRQVKRRSRPLIVMGLVVLAVAALLFVTLLWLQAEIGSAGYHKAESLRTICWPVAVSMFLAAGSGVVCIVLGCIPFGFRLMATGILLLGVAAACAAFLAAARHIESEKAAVYGFVIAVTGLSGLVCSALGLVRLLSRRKGI